MNKKIRILLLLGMMLMSQAINAQCRDLDTKKLAEMLKEGQGDRHDLKGKGLFAGTGTNSIAIGY